MVKRLIEVQPSPTIQQKCRYLKPFYIDRLPDDDLLVYFSVKELVKEHLEKAKPEAVIEEVVCELFVIFIKSPFCFHQTKKPIFQCSKGAGQAPKGCFDMNLIQNESRISPKDPFALPVQTTGLYIWYFLCVIEARYILH